MYDSLLPEDVTPEDHGTVGRGLRESSSDTSSSSGARQLSRRGMLALASGLAVSVAGCNGDGSTGTATDTAAGPTASRTATPDTTTAETETATAAQGPAAVARTFVQHLDAGEYEAASEMLGGSAGVVFDASLLEWYWQGRYAQHGELTSVTVDERSEADPGTKVRMSLACQQDTAQVAPVVDEEGAITTIDWGGSYSPPAYADESTFDEREVTLPGSASLPGTLTVPGDTGPHPGVVLVHGTGGHDRDETIGANKPFRDLAWGLASRGVAVLRYQKRNHALRVEESDWTLDRVTVDDAVSAAERLRSVESVADDSVFVVGHSQGAMAAPRIARKDGRLAGIGMLAGNARPITDVLMAQNRRLLKARGGSLSDSDQRKLDRLEDTIERVENREYEPGRLVGNIPAALLYSMLDYDQRATARSLTIPVFLGHGGRDWQVAPKNVDIWLDAFDDGQASAERYADLNHLFQPGFEPSMLTEYYFFDSVAEAVAVDLAEWVTETASSG